MDVRERIFDKLAQLENWTEQLGEYMDATGRDIADARKHLDLVASMMDINAEKALQQFPDGRNEALVRYLHVRHQQQAG